MAPATGTNALTTAGTWVNLSAIFALELAALGALGYAASRGGAPLAVRIGLGIGVPLVAAILWGLFAAPNATFHNTAAMVTVKVLVFGAAAVGLVLTGHRTLGVLFAVAVVLTAVLAQVLPTADSPRATRALRIPAHTSAGPAVAAADPGLVDADRRSVTDGADS